MLGPVDFIVIAPVLKTRTNPDATPMGWESFFQLTERAICPAYALGGMSSQHINRHKNMVGRVLQQSEGYMMKNKGYVLIVALAVILILLLLSFFPAGINKDSQEAGYEVHHCNTITTGCEAQLDKSRVKIRFPDNIVFLKSFPVEVHIDSPRDSVENVSVDFQMVGMNMGLNFYQLNKSSTDDSLWTGEGVLPVCTTGRTDWQAIVALQSGGHVRKVAFQFEVGPPTQ